MYKERKLAISVNNASIENADEFTCLDSLLSSSVIKCRIGKAASVLDASYCYRNSVRLSVCHTDDPRLNGSVYGNMLCAAFDDRVTFL